MPDKRFVVASTINLWPKPNLWFVIDLLRGSIVSTPTSGIVATELADQLNAGDLPKDVDVHA